MERTVLVPGSLVQLEPLADERHQRACLVGGQGDDDATSAPNHLDTCSGCDGQRCCRVPQKGCVRTRKLASPALRRGLGRRAETRTTAPSVRPQRRLLLPSLWSRLGPRQRSRARLRQWLGTAPPAPASARRWAAPTIWRRGRRRKRIRWRLTGAITNPVAATEHPTVIRYTSCWNVESFSKRA